MNDSTQGYVAVPLNSDESTVVTNGMKMNGEQHVRTSEAFNLTWTDSFYDNEPDVLAVFDVDYPHLRQTFGRRLWLFCIFFSAYFANISLPFLTTNYDDMDDGSKTYLLMTLGCFVFMFVVFCRLNIKQMLHQQNNLTGIHVAVTKNGLRKDVRNFPLGAVFQTTTLIPFNEIKTISFQRDATLNCCVKNTGPGYVTVIAKSDGSPNIILGVSNPEALVNLVKNMMQVDGLKQVV